MDKRIGYAIAGVAAVVAVVWLTTRGEPVAVEKTLAAPTTISVAPADTWGGNASPGSSAASAAAPANGSTESREARQPGEIPPSSPAGPSLPIDVSPGFEYLGKPASEMKDTDYVWSTWRRHQELQAEPRDESWAPPVEASIRDTIEKSLTSRGYDKQRLDLPVVECRTNGCEIQVVGLIENTQKDFEDLQQVMMMAMAGDLRHQFDDAGVTITVGMSPDLKQFQWLSHLPRKKP